MSKETEYRFNTVFNHYRSWQRICIGVWTERSLSCGWVKYKKKIFSLQRAMLVTWCENSVRRVFGVHLKPIQTVVYSYSFYCYQCTGGWLYLFLHQIILSLIFHFGTWIAQMKYLIWAINISTYYIFYNYIYIYIYIYILHFWITGCTCEQLVKLVWRLNNCNVQPDVFVYRHSIL